MRGIDPVAQETGNARPTTRKIVSVADLASDIARIPYGFLGVGPVDRELGPIGNRAVVAGRGKTSRLGHPSGQIASVTRGALGDTRNCKSRMRGKEVRRVIALGIDEVKTRFTVIRGTSEGQEHPQKH